MFDGCIMKWNIVNQFWTYIFLILPKSIQRRFFHMIPCKWLLKIHIIYHEYESKRVPHTQKKINWFIYISKITLFPLLFWRYSKLCNSTPNPSWTIYAHHFSILQAVRKIHCLYANAIVQPSLQHCACCMAWKTNVHTWCRHCHLCTNAPMWREKRWLQGLFDPPSYMLFYIDFHGFLPGKTASSSTPPHLPLSLFLQMTKLYHFVLSTMDFIQGRLLPLLSPLLLSLTILMFWRETGIGRKQVANMCHSILSLRIPPRYDYV